MAAAKKPTNPMLALLEGGLWRMGLAIALLVALGVGLFLAWGRWGAPAIASGRQVTTDAIQCTAQPPWIRANLVEQAVTEGSLDQLSVFDPQATVQVARAFEMHPWVKRVTRVSKHSPANFRVELTYREPVAMVVVQSNEGTKLLPVDEEAVILPADDFLALSEEKIRSYPRVHVANAIPQGMPGSPWGDRRVTDAARISRLLIETWAAWGLYRMHSIEQQAAPNSPAESIYVLATRSGGELVWGHAPGNEVAGEPTAEVKVQRLLQYVEQNGSLANLASNELLDLRSHDLKPIEPRTAQLQPVTLP